MASWALIAAQWSGVMLSSSRSWTVALPESTNRMMTGRSPRCAAVWIVSGIWSGPGVCARLGARLGKPVVLLGRASSRGGVDDLAVAKRGSDWPPAFETATACVAAAPRGVPGAAMVDERGASSSLI